tara:strand:+ start:8184 stop:11630 length:3447 start_codon:yes stop_codon:yes gene_type:complete
MEYGEEMNMRSVILVLTLLCSTLSPLAAASVVSDQDLPQSDSPNIDVYPSVLESYSAQIQAAIAHKSDLSRYSEVELQSTTNWLVFSPIERSEPAGELEGAWLVELDPKHAIDTVQSMLLNGEIEAAYPLVESQMETRWTPNDPKFADQWHLQNTGQTGGTSGQDVNITGAWNSYRGNGVVIGIVDDGLDWTHPDLDNYYESTLDYDYCSNDGDPSPASNDAHGTASAGVAAGVGDNNIGVSGSAPRAGLAGLQLISCSTTDIRESGALGHERQDIDIYSNSWGPSDDGETLEGPGAMMVKAIEDDALLGRNGLGNIITWAAGNGLAEDDNSNYDGYANLRYTIAVTAVDHKGRQSYYAEPGANILLAAPSNGDGESITTTDNEGSGGYSNSDYTDSFGGTSSATPLVSGVIALMLEANANLTWRDVQHILVHTSRQNHANDDSWAVNGAGHDVSHKYGYGVVDAGAAVSMAETWVSVEEETSLTTGTMNVDVDIPDDSSAGITETTAVLEAISVESVDVIVDIPHTYRGDLRIILTSPSGTESVLSEKHEDGGNNFNNWRFSTVHNWDEDSRGNWSLYIEDQGNNDVGTLDSWELIIHGTQIDLDTDGDNLTNANETNVYGTNPEVFDTDGDTIGDGDEVLVYGTNPLVSDSDGDGLSDGVEIYVNQTDPLNNDTDGDLLLDGLEVLYYGTNPLVADPDADADDYYWFEDCNDSNPAVNPAVLELLNGIDDNCDGQWDEGFNATDTDQDGLSDFGEYHYHGTNLSMADTDGDFLSDGVEVLETETDPLVFDNDTDGDSFYWFEDCNDTDAEVYPSAPELLDNIDNNCDGVIDETFVGTDADSDGLLDLVEYLDLETNPFDPDTDGDGLLDGIEVLSTNTNPLVPDLDNDGDGFRWFADCDDNMSNRSPDEVERWNGIDDNCDEEIDENVDRSLRITPAPLVSSLNLNATNDTLELSLLVGLSQDDVERLNLTVQWFRNQTQIGTGATFIEAPHSCEQPNETFSIELCALNGTTEPFEVKAVVFDDYGFIETTWSVTYFVWHPPIIVEDTVSESDASEQATSTVFEDNLLLVALSGIVVILAVILVFTRRQNSKLQPSTRPKQQPAQFAPAPASMPAQYADVMPAPNFSQLGEYTPPTNNQWDTGKWK